MARYFCTAFILLALAATTRAATLWTLTTADFHTQPVLLKTIDAGGVHVTPAAGGDEIVIPFAQFLELKRSVLNTTPAGKFVLHLASGDEIAGEPLAIQGNDLLWSSPILGEFAVPMKQLLALARPGATLPDARQREDVVTLANGDTLRGIVAAFAAGKVTVEADAGNSDVPLTSVSQINFAATAGGLVPANGYRVRFDDGSSVIAPALTSAADTIALTLGKQGPRTVDLGRVALIEQVNGPVSWLSSRPTLESVYVPFIGSPRANAARMDRNWSGQDPIRFGAQEFAHGIGVHAYSRLSWALDGSYKAFRTRYAIDTKDANTRADVTVRILLDGKVVHEQPHVRAGMLSPVIVENLGDAKKLTLEVDYGDNLDTQDRFNWIEAALVK